jgi:protein SCO1/2
MNRFLSIVLLIMLLVTSVALFATKDNNVALPPDSSSGKATIGGAFTLTNQDGKQISDSEFRGKYMLVFFGFTRCPMICPTSMATITAALDILGDKAGSVAPVFITIDPQFDTPAQLKDFLANFSPKIIGLTGTPKQIEDVAAAYKAYYSEHDGAMDHSTFLYLMDGKGEYITHFPYDMAADELAKNISEHMK